METFLTYAAQNGFSVAVAAYLLVRMESRLEDLTRAIQELSLCYRPPSAEGHARHDDHS